MPSIQRLRPLLLGAFIAALLLGGLVHGGAANERPIGSQHDFVTICKKFGSTPTSAGTHIVTCTGPGLITTCNFNTGICTDVLLGLAPTPPSDAGSQATPPPAPGGQTLAAASTPPGRHAASRPHRRHRAA